MADPGCAGRNPRERTGKRCRSVAAVFLAAVLAVSILISLQGWKSRPPALDMFTHIRNARAFLDSGVLPRHGDTGSYSSYKPPGTAWLMMPGMMVLADARVSDYVGTALLHGATLLGIFLLARKHFGDRCAYLSVLLYALSAHGLFLAGSLWPNGRPDFYVWIVYFVDRWVTGHDGRSLATAAGIWGAGMYVDMGITPALFIVPAIALLYRAPWRLGSLTAALAIVAVIWFPYLSFEQPRGFVDIRSQLLQERITLANYREVWCDPSLTMLTWDDGRPEPAVAQGVWTGPRVLRAALRRASGLADKTVSNFRNVAPVPGLDVLLLTLTLGGMVIFSGAGMTSARPPASDGRRGPVPWNHPVVLGMSVVVLLGIAFALREVPQVDGATATMARLLQRAFQLLGLGGGAMVLATWIGSALNRALIRAGTPLPSADRAERTRLLVLCLLIPWIVLVIVAEPGKPERFWWIWPLQVMFLSAFVTSALPRLSGSRLASRVAEVAVVLAVVANPFLVSRVQAWAADGFAGKDAEPVRVVDHLAGVLKAEGRDSAAVGYSMFFYPFMAMYNITNPLYKVGTELDFLLASRHGIANINRCAEGVHPDDEYRIVQVTPQPQGDAPRHYFEVSLEGFRVLAEVGSYRLLKRDTAAGEMRPLPR